MNKTFMSVLNLLGVPEEEVSEVLTGWRSPDADFDTLAVQESIDPCTFSTNSLMIPIVTSSVFIQQHPAHEDSPTGYHYGRCGNPTRDLFEHCMARLDGAKFGIAFSAGVAGICAIAQTLRSGDHVLYLQCSNGDSDYLFRNKWKDFKIEVEFVYESDWEGIKPKIKPNTKMIWMETPANPTLILIDLETLAAAVHSERSDIIIVVDNTLMTPVMQRPLDLGADCVVYSCTKYLCGHADVCMGVVTMNCESLYKKIRENEICMGGIPSPFDCYLMVRSLKTLPIRMKKHFESGVKVAQFLEKHPNVEKVLHPGLKSHPQSDLARRQQFGHSGMVAFYIKGCLEQSSQFLESLKLIRKASSLGGDMSLASIPSKGSHSWVPVEERMRLNITDNLIRLSVGLEGVEAIVRDLDQALCKIEY